MTPLPNNTGGFADMYNSGQRCLVFCEDTTLLESLIKDEWTERVQQEWGLSISSCGLSLVDDVMGREVLYAAITRWVREDSQAKIYSHMPPLQGA